MHFLIVQVLHIQEVGETWQLEVPRSQTTHGTYEVLLVLFCTADNSSVSNTSFPPSPSLCQRVVMVNWGWTALCPMWLVVHVSCCLCHYVFVFLPSFSLNFNHVPTFRWWPAHMSVIVCVCESSMSRPWPVFLCGRHGWYVDSLLPSQPSSFTWPPSSIFSQSSPSSSHCSHHTALPPVIRLESNGL